MGEPTARKGCRRPLQGELRLVVFGDCHAHAFHVLNTFNPVHFRFSSIQCISGSQHLQSSAFQVLFNPVHFRISTPSIQCLSGSQHLQSSACACVSISGRCLFVSGCRL